MARVRVAAARPGAVSEPSSTTVLMHAERCEELISQIGAQRLAGNLLDDGSEEEVAGVRVVPGGPRRKVVERPLPGDVVHTTEPS